MSKGAKKEEKGLSFPVTNAAKGERSTTTTGKNIIAAAMRGAGTTEAEELAKKCEKEKNFRFNYQKHYMKMVKLSAQSPSIALQVANAGQDYMHKNFDFIDPTTKECTKFDDHMKNTKVNGTFKTHVVKGTGAKGGKPLVVPYKNKMLEGASLKAQLTKWADYGTIEPDAAQAISKVAEGKLDLAGQHFVLIGAGSAMGPFIKLLEHGATVVCIDIPGAWGAGPQKTWKRLVDTARSSAGSIIIPTSKDSFANDEELFASAGCNLTEQPKEILNWLSSVAPGTRLTVGNYTYLDGDLHVKLSLAADGILKHLCQVRRDTAIAFLCTPTDIHVVPDAAHRAAKENYGMHPGRLLEGLINIMTFGRKLVKNALPPVKCADGSSVKLCDGLSVAQGPNYALAKRLQHWRAMLEYEAGHVVSSNIAPSTATLSVVSNKSFGWAYGGMPYFKPYEIFQQETTNAVMAGLLVANVTQEESAANPANRKEKGVTNTLELFKCNSVHGGLWRAAYKVDSIGEVSVFIHFLGGPDKVLFVLFFTFAAAIVGFMKFTGRL